MRVDVAVSGLRHLESIACHLEAAGVLGRFYYAHRRSTGAEVLGVPAGKLVNIWPKAYLGAGFERLVGSRFHVAGREVYDLLFDYPAAHRLRGCDLLHLVMQGKFRRLFEAARKNGALVLGEVLNSHPRTMRTILEEEHARLGLGRAPAVSGTDRQVEALAPQADHLLAPAAFVARSFVEHGCAADRITVLPFGIDPVRFQPPAVRDGEGPFRVLCVGQVSPRKGQVYLLEAWRKLALPDAELVLIGGIDDGMAPVLQRYQGQFTYLGRVGRDELARHYGRAHVFVLPALEDAFAYVVTEALACGLPVITTENTGAGELLREGVDGFVLPIRAVDALAEKILLLYRDPALREQMAAAALASAERLTWAGYADRLVGLYRQVLDRARA